MASMYAHMCTRMHINAKAEACRENICSCGREPCLQSMAKLLRMMHAIGTWHHVPCTRSIVKSRRHNLMLLRKLRNTQETSLWNYSNDQQDFWTKQKNGNTKLDPNSLYPLRVPSYKCRSIRFTLENWVTMPGTLWKYNHSQWSENSMLSMMQSRPLCELENEACYRPWTAGVCVSEIIHITLQRWTLKVMPHYSHCGINAHVSCIRWCTIFCYHFGTQFLCNTQAAMHHQEPILKRIVLLSLSVWQLIQNLCEILILSIFTLHGLQLIMVSDGNCWDLCLPKHSICHHILHFVHMHYLEMNWDKKLTHVFLKQLDLTEEVSQKLMISLNCKISPKQVFPSGQSMYNSQ